MKKVRYPILISFLTLIFLISCSIKKDRKKFDKSQIRGEVAEVFDAYVYQVNSKGINGVGTYFSNDDRFYWVEDGRLQYPSRDSLIAGIKQFYPSVDSLNMQVSKTEIQVINQKYATLYAKYKEDIALKSGYKFTLDGAMTALMIREDESWKFLNGHSSVKKPREGS